MLFFVKLKQKILNSQLTRRKSVLAILIVVGFLAFFNTHTALAAEGADFLDGSWTIIPLLKAVLTIVGVLLSVAETIFQWIVVPSNMKAVMDNAVVYEMWRFVRDFFNTSLIMILLFSAFATIFHASTGYHYKKVLLNLVLMALLVNFSYPIARFIVDMSNVFMYGFLNQLGGDGSFMSIITQSGIKDILNPKGNPGIPYLFAAVIFTFMFAVTLLTIAVLLVIRTIALTIFIIFSPIAFLGSTQPGTDLANAASGWWKEFMKYCFAGPIMIFMLILANRMMIAVSSASNGLGTIAKLQATNADLSGLISSISFFSLPLVILWIGIDKAQSSGIAGASMVVGQGTKAMKWVGKNLTSRPASALVHKAERGLAKGKYTWMLSPTAFKSAWKENQAELDRKAFKSSGATGGWRDTINMIPLIGDGKSNFRDAARQANVALKEKELEATSTNSEYLMKEFEKAEASKDTEKLAAVLRILFKDNDQNEFMKLSGKDVDPFEMKREIYRRLLAAGMNDQEALKHMSDLGEIAVGKGNFANYGMASFNPETGLYEINDDETQAGAAASKTSNIKAQTKADLWHWNSLVVEQRLGKRLDENGKEIEITQKAGELHDAGKELLRTMSGAEIDQMGRLRPDFIKNIINRIEDINTFANEVETGYTNKKGIEIKGDKNQANLIRKFATNIKNINEGKEIEKVKAEKTEKETSKDSTTK